MKAGNCGARSEPTTGLRIRQGEEPLRAQVDAAAKRWIRDHPNRVTTAHPRERDAAETDQKEENLRVSGTTEQLPTIGDLDVEGERVLLRADFDVPLAPAADATGAQVADARRIRAALVTIEELRRRGARVILLAHLGLPKGRDPTWSMRPIAEQLARLTGSGVPLAPGVVGAEVRELTERLEPGEIMMLENARFEPGETRNDPQLGSALAELADLYVDDAFACAHQAYASTEAVARRLPGAAGRLMQREVYALTALIERPAHPLVAVLGGANIRDKTELIHRFLEQADAVCIGGALCFPFLAALGHDVGRPIYPEDNLESARAALAAAAGFHGLKLPEDLLLSRGGAGQSSELRRLDGVDVPENWTAVDIGARTASRYAAEVAKAAAVFWNGPMGRLELAPAAAGTRAIAEAVVSTSAITVVAGADTAKALRSDGVEHRVSHVSSGGEATLRFLQGRRLPGIQALLRAPVASAVVPRCDSQEGKSVGVGD
jgi:phosphoglycerate kinase